jgi:DNA-binding MarR family transcriptional regulator
MSNPRTHGGALTGSAGPVVVKAKDDSGADGTLDPVPSLSAWFDPARPDLLMGVLLGDTTALIRRVFDRRVRHLGFTRAQWKIACQMAIHDGLSQSELADIADIERAPLGKLLDRMEAAGWIERRDDPLDRRIRRVYRTNKLIAFMPELAKAGEVLMADILQALSREELTATIAALEKMKATLTALDSESP